jgi:hypothetical protein
VRTCCFIGEWEGRGLCSGFVDVPVDFVLEVRAVNVMVFLVFGWVGMCVFLLRQVKP